MSSSPPAINAPRAIVWLFAIMVALHLLSGTLLSTEFLYRYFAFYPIRFTPIGFAHLGGLPASIWSWVTYNFLHGDFGHLAINILWMLAFGSAVAWRVGTMRFLAFSAMCGAAGALAHLIAHWGEGNAMIGASAAISGQMAAAIRFIFNAQGALGGLGAPARRHQTARLMTVTETFQDRRSFAFLAIWAIIQLLIGVSSMSFGGIDGSVAWEAHIGGFVAGLLLFAYFDPPPPPQRSYYRVE